jgi:uncharacterized protein (TIGR01777 family)
MQTRRVLLSGGTGLIGTAFAESQQSFGHTVVKLVRGTSPARTNEVTWRPDQPLQPLAGASELSLLEGCDAAVHLAGANLSAHRWTDAYKRTILSSRTDSSQALVEILSRLKTPPRVLVCASATGIYGDRGDEILTEDSTPGQGFLPDVCKAWEASPDAAKALGIRVVHLRFGVVLAPAGGALQKLSPIFKAALGGQLGDGRQWMSWTTLAGVVRAIEFALVNEAAAGAFNTTAPNPVTNAEFTRALAKAVHRPAPWIVPAFALRLMFGQMAQDTLLASSRVLPARLEAMGFSFGDPLIAPALKSLL